MIELQTTCRKILLTVVEIGKAKLPVKVFLMTAGCVAVVTAGPKYPFFPHILSFCFHNMYKEGNTSC